MRVVECYEAVDGKIFTNVADCKKHEEIINIDKHIEAIKDFCYRNDCDLCPLHSEFNFCQLNGNPAQWKR